MITVVSQIRRFCPQKPVQPPLYLLPESSYENIVFPCLQLLFTNPNKASQKLYLFAVYNKKGINKCFMFVSIQNNWKYKQYTWIYSLITHFVSYERRYVTSGYHICFSLTYWPIYVHYYPLHNNFGYSCKVYQRIVYDLQLMGVNMQNHQCDHVSYTWNALRCFLFVWCWWVQSEVRDKKKKDRRMGKKSKAALLVSKSCYKAAFKMLWSAKGARKPMMEFWSKQLKEEVRTEAPSGWCTRFFRTNILFKSP